MRIPVILPVAGVALVCGVFGLDPLLGTAAADAGPARQYSLSSRAEALQATVSSAAVPFGIPVGGSSYGARAAVDSNGGSAADAGAPYSPLVSSLPKTGNGAAQGTFGVSLPVVPTMPGYVAADYPLAPSSTVTAGAYELVATAEETEAWGLVGIGAQGDVSSRNNFFAEAHTARQAQGNVIAEAASGISALRVDGVFEIADVSSRLSLLVDSDSRPDLRGATTFGTVTLAGLTSGVTDANASLAGTQVPLDTSSIGAVNDALRPAGITVQLLPQSFTYTDGSTSSGTEPIETKTLTAVRSSAVQVVVTRDVEGQGTQSLTMTMGQVAVAATNVAIPEYASAPGAATATGSDQVGPAGSGQLPPSTGTLDSAHLVPGRAAGLIPGTTNGVPTVDLAPTGVDGLRPPVPTAAVEFLMGGRTPGDSLYLVLILVAVVGLVGSQVVRRGAVRCR